MRCLLDDLELKKAPPASEPLDQMDNQALAKAREMMLSRYAGAEPISELDDRRFWKVKIVRWRGALWTTEDEAWLVAVGHRREGDVDDFYSELGSRARKWKSEYNKYHTPPVKTDALTNQLMPNQDDYDRILLEDSLRIISDLNSEMRDLVITSASTGAEARGEAFGCDIGVLLRPSELGEVYVSVRIVGRIPDVAEEMYFHILNGVPIVTDPQGWFIETMPDRPGDRGEIAWSNLIDSKKLKLFLDE